MATSKTSILRSIQTSTLQFADLTKTQLRYFKRLMILKPRHFVNVKTLFVIWSTSKSKITMIKDSSV